MEGSSIGRTRGTSAASSEPSKSAMTGRDLCGSTSRRRWLRLRLDSYVSQPCPYMAVGKEGTRSDAEKGPGRRARPKSRSRPSPRSDLWGRTIVLPGNESLLSEGRSPCAAGLRAIVGPTLPFIFPSLCVSKAKRPCRRFRGSHSIYLNGNLGVQVLLRISAAFALVDLHVRSQVAGLSEALATAAAHIRLLPAVRPEMSLQVEVQREPLATVTTLVGTLALCKLHRMHQLVPFQLRLVSEAFAAVWMRANVVSTAVLATGLALLVWRCL